MLHAPALARFGRRGPARAKARGERLEQRYVQRSAGGARVATVGTGRRGRRSVAVGGWKLFGHRDAGESAGRQQARGAARREIVDAATTTTRAGRGKGSMRMRRAATLRKRHGRSAAWGRGPCARSPCARGPCRVSRSGGREAQRVRRVCLAGALHSPGRVALEAAERAGLTQRWEHARVRRRRRRAASVGPEGGGGGAHAAGARGRHDGRYVAARETAETIGAVGRFSYQPPHAQPPPLPQHGVGGRVVVVRLP
eukprot:7385188-Prymnesium_polylepis.2